MFKIAQYNRKYKCWDCDNLHTKVGWGLLWIRKEPPHKLIFGIPFTEKPLQV